MKHHARLFVAAPLPDPVAAALEKYAPAYEKPGVRIIPQENRHLTFYFIGNVPAAKITEITNTIHNLAAGFEPFTLKLVRVAPGPNARNPRLVWAMFAENKAFEKLVRKITIGLGGKMENQNPIAHVTLARFAKDLPKPPKLPVLPAETNLTFEVSKIALWQSELGSPHPKYSVLQTFEAAATKTTGPEEI